MSAHGHDDLDNEEAELRAFADRDDPRADLGYQPAPPRPAPEVHPTLEPRSSKPPPGVGHWAITWVPGDPARPEQHGGPVGGSHVCDICKKPTDVLHAFDDDPRYPNPVRRMCGTCQGERNLARVGGGR